MHDANGCYQLLLEGISHGHLTQSLTTDGDGYHVAPFFTVPINERLRFNDNSKALSWRCL
jgi:hypothetical protein